MNPLRLLIAAASAIGLAAPAAGADAATTVSVVDVPTRGATQRFLYVRPDAPVANVISLPGRDGRTGVADDGSIPTILGRCTPFFQNRDAFAVRGFALAIVDEASDGKVRQFGDLYEIARYMRNRANVPTWIVGGSGSTTAAVNFALEFPAGEPLGVIVFSPFWRSPLPQAALVMRPTLVIYHRDDPGAVPPPMKERVDSLFDSLTAAPRKERIELVGGTKMDECGGYHLFRGIDAAFVDAVAGFIDRNNTFPVPQTPK